MCTCERKKARQRGDRLDLPAALIWSSCVWCAVAAAAAAVAAAAAAAVGIVFVGFGVVFVLR